MEWTNQMQQLMRSWAEAQQKMAADWTTAMNQSAAPGKAAAEDWAAKWRDQAAANFETYLGKVGGVPGSVTERMFSGAQTFNQFVEFISGALGDLAPRMKAGGDWAGALKEYMETLQGKMNNQPQLWMKPESAAAMAGDMSELWKLFLGQAKSMSAPWLESLGQARGHLGEALGGDHRAVIHMANLFTDTFESTMGKTLGAPSIGYSREYQEKLTKTFDAWVEMKKAEVAFNTELTAIGFRAMGTLVETLKDKAGSGEKIESTRKLFDLWVDVAEKTYFEAASTESFAQTQADLVNASMRHRICEKTLLEVFYKAVHLPTRQEIDDAYRHMHDLRGQVKKLTKTAAALQAEVAALADGRQATLAAAQATAKESAKLRTEVAALKEFKKTALASSRTVARDSTKLKAEVAALKEFKKTSLAASRAAARDAAKLQAEVASLKELKKTASTGSATKPRPAAKKTAATTKKAPTAKAISKAGVKASADKPAGNRTTRTKAKEA